MTVKTQIESNRRELYGMSIGSAVFGRPFVERFAVCCRTVVLSVCLSVCNAGVLWPNGWMDQDETWHAGRPRPGHIVLDGDPASSAKG